MALASLNSFLLSYAFFLYFFFKMLIVFRSYKEVLYMLSSDAKLKWEVKRNFYNCVLLFAPGSFMHTYVLTRKATYLFFHSWSWLLSCGLIMYYQFDCIIMCALLGCIVSDNLHLLRYFCCYYSKYIIS